MRNPYKGPRFLNQVPTLEFKARAWIHAAWAFFSLGPATADASMPETTHYFSQSNLYPPKPKPKPYANPTP